MFQKKLLTEYYNVNSKKYGRLTILTDWKINAKKIIDIDPINFSNQSKKLTAYIEPKKVILNLKIQIILKSKCFFSK